MKGFLFVILILLGLTNCNKDVDGEVDAVYSNTLASDGCASHFSIKSSDTTINFAPSEGSQSKIQKAVGKSLSDYYIINVRLKYKLTGSKKSVQCGWGHVANFDEIDVISIKRR